MFTAKIFISAVLILSSLLAFSCKGDQVMSPGITVTSRISSENSLIAFVDIVTDIHSRVYIEYGNGDTGYFKTPVTQAQKSHIIPLVRLRESTKYNYKVRAMDDANVATTKFSGSLTSGPLPKDLKLGFKSKGKPSFDLTLMDISLTVAKKNYILILDRDSQVVWYHSTSDVPFNLNAIKQKQNFNLVYMLSEKGINEIDFLGNKIDELPVTSANHSHHDMILEDESSIFFLAARTTQVSSVPLSTSVIRRWDQVTDEITTVWDPLTYQDAESIINAVYLPLEKQKPDDHANTLFLAKRGNVLVSRRHTNEVFSIAPGWGDIEWILGGPNSDFAFEDPLDRFYGQHTPVETNDGTILIFDNGYGRPEMEGDQYSRAIEFKLDFENKVARKVWEYRPAKDIKVGRMGGLERLENGNTLINFGVTEKGFKDPIVLMEVTKDKKVIWKLESSIDAQIVRYRANSLRSISGGIGQVKVDEIAQTLGRHIFVMPQSLFTPG